MTRITSSQRPSTYVSNAYIQLGIFSIGNIIRDRGSRQVVPERRRKKGREGVNSPTVVPAECIVYFSPLACRSRCTAATSSATEGLAVPTCFVFQLSVPCTRTQTRQVGCRSIRNRPSREGRHRQGNAHLPVRDKSQHNTAREWQWSCKRRS